MQCLQLWALLHCLCDLRVAWHLLSGLSASFVPLRALGGGFCDRLGGVSLLGYPAGNWLYLA